MTVKPLLLWMGVCKMWCIQFQLKNKTKNNPKPPKTKPTKIEYFPVRVQNFLVSAVKRENWWSITRTEKMFDQIDISFDLLLILKTSRLTQDTRLCRCLDVFIGENQATAKVSICKRHLGLKMCIHFHMLNFICKHSHKWVIVQIVQIL